MPHADAAGATRLAERLAGLTRCIALSRLITESLNLSEVLERIMATSCQTLDVETVSLLLVDETPGPGQGELVFTVAQGPASHGLRSGYRLAPGEGIAGWVAREAKPVMLDDVYEDPRFCPDVDRRTGYRTRSMLCVPLVYRGRVIGVIQGINKCGGGVFTDDDLELFSLLGAQAAVAIVNARLHRQALDKQRMDFDMEVAASVQQGFWPKAPPPLPGFDVAGVSLPCDATGGDYYDYIMRGADDPHGPSCLVVVGDVTGHGVQAALLMASARAYVRARMLLAGGPSAIANDVNRLLAADLGMTGRFMTLFMLELCPSLGRMRYVRAGHDPALLYDPAGDTFIELVGRGIPLGIDGDWRYEDHVVPDVPAGALLALGTDGIWETRRPGGEMYGKDRLRRVLRRTAGETARTVAEAVLADLERFRQGEPTRDDITLVVVKATPGVGKKETA